MFGVALLTGACGSATTANMSTVSSGGSESTVGAATSATPGALTGMGATVAQMGAQHGVDQIPGGACSAEPHCFGASIKNDENALYQFTSISVGNGLIDGYSQAFLPNTTLANAESGVLQWLPPDSRMSAVTPDNNGGGCAMFNITSPTLAKLFTDPKIGDPQGVVGVQVGYIDANLTQVYDPNNIQHAYLTIGPSDPTAACG